jgi:hypothetical protein
MPGSLIMEKDTEEDTVAFAALLRKKGNKASLPLRVEAGKRSPDVSAQ